VNEPIDAARGCAASGLPAGLKFAAKETKDKTFGTVAAGTVYGVPTKAGEYTVYFKKYEKVNGKTVNHQASATFRVSALPAWAQGTFAGGVGGGHAGHVTLPGGQVSLTVSAAGKVSGKALSDGIAYTLTAPYYAEFATIDDGDSVTSNFLADVTAAWSYKEGAKTVKTNGVVQLVVQDNGVGGVAMGTAAGDSRPPVWTVSGGPQSSAAASETELALPVWVAWQYNWKVEPWKTLGKKFDKQTLAYAILKDGSFSDNNEDIASALGEDVTGRVTLKFAASGAVSISGEFVSDYDSKKQKYTIVKATGSATLVPVEEGHGEVFIYLLPKGLPIHTRSLSVPLPAE